MLQEKLTSTYPTRVNSAPLSSNFWPFGLTKPDETGAVAAVVVVAPDVVATVDVAFAVVVGVAAIDVVVAALGRHLEPTISFSPTRRGKKAYWL